MTPQGSLALIRRLWPFARPYTRYVWILFAVMLLEAPLTLVMPLILEQVIDGAVGGAGSEGIFKAALVLVGLITASILLRMVIGYCSLIFRVKVFRDLRLHLHAHLQSLSLSYYNRKETGFLMSRQVDDVRSLGGAMADTWGRAAISALKALTCVVLLFYVEWRLAVGGLVLALVTFGFQYFISPELRRRSRRAQEAWTTLTEALHQIITGHHLIRAAASERREARRFARFLHGSIRADVRRDLLAMVTRNLFDLIAALMPITIILGGVLLIVDGSFTVGGLFAFYIYLDMMFQAVGQLTGLNPALQAAAASLERIYEILDTESELPVQGQVVAPPKLTGEVVFEEVSFAYEPGRDVLRGINIRAAPRTRVALVGPSGAGKSTLIQLIPRFYDPTEGCLLVDGHDIMSLDLQVLRSQIGIVPQDVFLFDRTLRENIAYGRPRASMEEIREAARAANALDFIEAMEDGFDSVVGERGVRLSGGQRQRIAIAREILRDPAILILDEATSALDSTSEKLIQEALDRLLAGRTSFVIAHRLSTILQADVILVLDRGRIVEQGRHADLLVKNGLYTRLYHAQFERFLEEEAAPAGGRLVEPRQV